MQQHEYSQTKTNPLHHIKISLCSNLVSSNRLPKFCYVTSLNKSNMSFENPSEKPPLSELGQYVCDEVCRIIELTEEDFENASNKDLKQFDDLQLHAKYLQQRTPGDMNAPWHAPAEWLVVDLDSILSSALDNIDSKDKRPLEDILNDLIEKDALPDRRVPGIPSYKQELASILKALIATGNLNKLTGER